MPVLKLQTLNLDTLVEVVDTARHRAVAHPRWLSAINTAYDYLLTSGDTIQIAADGTAFIPSTSKEVVYAANGVCQCQAFTHHLPCWHRAAARLLQRYRETLEAKADYLMHQVEAAENRGDWELAERLNQRWSDVEMALCAIEA